MKVLRGTWIFTEHSTGISRAKMNVSSFPNHKEIFTYKTRFCFVSIFARYLYFMNKFPNDFL